MQKDKSRIKDVWRDDSLRDALVWVPDDSPVPFAASVTHAFEDASVRFSQGGETGSGFYESFASSADWHFYTFPNVHTFIMCFDDKRHVPVRKATTQASRREAMERACVRRQVRQWDWNGRSTIVSLSDDPLPPWDRLRLSHGAYARAVSDVVDLLRDTYHPPAGRRLILDEGWRILLIESTMDGRVLHPLSIPDDWRPSIGEADMSAQWYAAAVRAGQLQVPTTHLVERGRLMDEKYYQPHMTIVPPERWYVSGRVSEASVRRQWEYGDMLLVTTDTDFVTLSLGWMANIASEANIYVSIGRIHFDALGTIVSGRHVDARPHREYVNVRRLWNRVSRVHQSSEDLCALSAWSFVAFSTACGNDYTQRMSGFSHRSMFSGYLRWLRSSEARLLIERCVVADGKPLYLLDPVAFQRMLVHCYFERLHEKNRPPRVVEWPQMTEFVRQAERTQRHMPDVDALKNYYEQISWSLAYASSAPHGVEHVPL